MDSYDKEVDKLMENMFIYEYTDGKVEKRLNIECLRRMPSRMTICKKHKQAAMGNKAPCC